MTEAYTAALLALAQTLKTAISLQELLPRYRAVTEAYMAALLALSFRLLRALALALDLPPEHFTPFFDPPSPFLRPLHYAARASAPEQVHVPSMSLRGRPRTITSHNVLAQKSHHSRPAGQPCCGLVCTKELL